MSLLKVSSGKSGYHCLKCYFHKLPVELEQVQSLARKYAKEKLSPVASQLDKNNAFPAEIIQDLGNMGMMSVAVSKANGGSQLGTLGLSLVVEEISAGCASTGAIVSIHNCLYANLLDRFANQAQKVKFLQQQFTSGTIGCFALSEPDAGSDVAAIKTTATVSSKNKDYFQLNGIKSWVTSGTVGKVAVVFASVDRALQHKGITAFIVPLDTPGITIGVPENKLGIRAAPCCNIIFDNVSVSRENILGNIGEGFKLAMNQLEQARIGIASQALGIGQAALDAAVLYSFKRIAFQRALKEFQAVKLRIADMALQLESSRLLVRRAACTFDEKGRASKEASMAKTAASQAANAIAYSAIQIHGGMGFIKEIPVERHFRDARVTEIYGGVTDIQKLVVADFIFAEHAAKHEAN